MENLQSTDNPYQVEVDSLFTPVFHMYLFDFFHCLNRHSNLFTFPNKRVELMEEFERYFTMTDDKMIRNTIKRGREYCADKKLSPYIPGLIYCYFFYYGLSLASDFKLPVINLKDAKLTTRKKNGNK